MYFLYFLSAAVLGVFGSGYLSEAKNESEDFTIQYSRFLRQKTESQINFEINTRSKTGISFWVDGEVLKFLNFERIVPRPDKISFKDDRMIFSFGNIEGSVKQMRVGFEIKPIKIGSVEWQAGLEGGSVYRIKQFTYP